MDGAGKSTAAGLVQGHLEAKGRPAHIAWARLGAESALLDRLGAPVKRVVRRSGTTADPVAAGGPDVVKTRDPREGQGRRRAVSWAWIVVVAVVNASSYRRAASARGRGVDVICDRWATDGLVDLRLRYGPHRVAETLLARLTPRRNLGILLHVDARTAARRKPGDQAPHILEAMEAGYAQRARHERLVIIDGRLPLAEVERRLIEAVDRLTAGRPA
jgi:thymidylate kinase